MKTNTLDNLETAIAPSDLAPADSGHSDAARRCEECAFTKGTEANAALWTRITIELCLVAREPFHCHSKGILEPLCAGYVQALALRPPEPEWRRDLAGALLELQQVAATGPDSCLYVNENFAECLEIILEEISPERAAHTASPPAPTEAPQRSQSLQVEPEEGSR